MPHASPLASTACTSKRHCRPARLRTGFLFAGKMSRMSDLQKLLEETTRPAVTKDLAELTETTVSNLSLIHI